MSTTGKQSGKEKDPTLNARASKRNASTSHCQPGKGGRRRPSSPLLIRMRLRLMWDLKFTMPQCPKAGIRCQFAALGLTPAQFEELVQWFKDCEIKTVAMESTGVYWIPLYQKLEEAGFKVLLVDARQVKHVPGRKSDVQDCQWLQQLHSYGLLWTAFRPEDSICRLRTLQRHRKNLVECGAMWIQHIQKALNEMNLHLHHVLTDISGQSGQAILDAILAGERDPKKLASLVDPRVKKSQGHIEAA
jgi:transposase